MAFATQLVVIYATESKILRRKIIVDEDSQLDVHQPGPGESRLLLPLSAPYDDPACRAAIAAATGAVPPSGRCCVLDGDGNVVGVCNADPALDTHPAGQLVADDLAGPGDRYHDGVFMPSGGITDIRSREMSSTSLRPLDNPVAVQASSIARADRCDHGAPDCPKPIAPSAI
jgi:hypothetical protein